MASSSHGGTHAPLPGVNLHCLQCDTQIGIFDRNEWVRITSSFVRSAHSGTHLATEVAIRTQVVPEGVSQRAVEGCTLAEVFCTKCSATVGQYCKAVPTAVQQRLLNQYFYKLSKTYLTKSETNERVEAIFGFSGDLVRPSARPSLIPHTNLPAASRWSQTPLRAGQSPSFPQPPTDSQSRTFNPVPSQGPGHDEAANPMTLQLALQDARLKSQEEKMMSQDLRIQQQDSHIRVLTSLLDSFRATLDDLKGSMQEIQSRQSGTGQIGSSEPDFLGNMESILRAVRNSQAGVREREELLAENAALKSRLHDIAAAIGPSSLETVSQPSSTSILGKRKRNNDVARSGGRLTHQNGLLQHRPGNFEVVSRPEQIPTPQASNPSVHSQDTSRPSRDPSPEQPQGDSTPQGVSEEDYQSQDPLEASATHSTSQTGNHGMQQETCDNDESRVAPDDGLHTQSSHFDDHSHTSRDAGEGMMEIDSAEHSGIQLSLGDSVEFSDDDNDQRLPPRSENLGSIQNKNQDLVRSQDSSAQEAAASTVASTKRTRSGATFDSTNTLPRETLERSVAPEPAVQSRTRVRRLTSKGRFEVTTPADLEEQIRRGSQPRHQRKQLQTTTKILNHELEDLGLEEWIGKDKNNSEYRKAVQEARDRQRDKNKLAQLVSRGMATLPQVAVEVTKSPLDRAFREATAALIDSTTNEESICKPSEEENTGNTSTAPRLTRKQEREAEIRRRDQLAKAAMEMNN